MTELKTLKDFEQLPRNKDVADYNCALDDLKQEAIKWVKRHLRFNPELNEWTLFGHMGIDEWMTFFNLTEEDLK